MFPQRSVCLQAPDVLLLVAVLRGCRPMELDLLVRVGQLELVGGTMPLWPTFLLGHVQGLREHVRLFVELVHHPVEWIHWRIFPVPFHCGRSSICRVYSSGGVACGGVLEFSRLQDWGHPLYPPIRCFPPIGSRWIRCLWIGDVVREMRTVVDWFFPDSRSQMFCEVALREMIF